MPYSCGHWSKPSAVGVYERWCCFGNVSYVYHDTPSPVRIFRKLAKQGLLQCIVNTGVRKRTMSGASERGLAKNIVNDSSNLDDSGAALWKVDMVPCFAHLLLYSRISITRQWWTPVYMSGGLLRLVFWNCHIWLHLSCLARSSFIGINARVVQQRCVQWTSRYRGTWNQRLRVGVTCSSMKKSFPVCSNDWSHVDEIQWTDGDKLRFWSPTGSPWARSSL